MTFEEKNEAIQRMQDGKHFESDARLLARYKPNAQILRQRANDFNRERLDGYVLKELFSVATLEQILDNRNDPEPRDLAAPSVPAPTVPTAQPAEPSPKPEPAPKKKETGGIFKNLLGRKSKP